MKTDEEYNTLAGLMAIKIFRIFKELDNEPPHVKQQLLSIINSRVQRLFNGTPDVIDGDHLIKEVPDSAIMPETVQPEHIVTQESSQDTPEVK